MANDREGDGAGEDGDLGSVLSDKTGEVTSVGENNDEINVKILNCGNSGSSKSFGGADRVRGEELDVRE